MNDLVSIIVPTYEKLELLIELLETVFMQDYDPIELIISDDASLSWNEHEFKIKEYILKTSGTNIKNIIIQHHEGNLGIVKNANFALKKSHGAYIKIIAGDDVFISQHAISDMVFSLKESGKYALVTPVCSFESGVREFVKIPIPNLKRVKHLTPSQLYRKLCITTFIPAPGVLFDRKVFDQIGFFDESYLMLEDLPFWLKMLQENISFQFSDFTCVGYRTGGISSAVTTAYTLDCKKAIDKCIRPYFPMIAFKRHRELLFIQKWTHVRKGSYFARLCVLIQYIDVTIVIFIHKIISKLKRKT